MSPIRLSYRINALTTSSRYLGCEPLLHQVLLSMQTDIFLQVEHASAYHKGRYDTYSQERRPEKEMNGGVDLVDKETHQQYVDEH